MEASDKKKWKKLVVGALCLVAAACIAAAVTALVAEQRTLQQQKELDELYSSGGASSTNGGEWDPETEDQGFLNPQFEDLYRINPDIVGWINIADKTLSAPVVQRDNEYYLTHDFYGKEDPHGTIFLDQRNQTDPNDDSLVIYGHNMRSTMFNVLANFQEAEFVAQNPIISFDTLYGTGQYVVVSVFLANTLEANGDIYPYHNMVYFQTFEEKEEYVAQLLKRSLIVSSADVTARDDLLTLSTCGYDFEGERIVVVARKLREDESAEQFRNVTVTKNPDPLMPEIWEKLYG